MLTSRDVQEKEQEQGQEPEILEGVDWDALWTRFLARLASDAGEAELARLALAPPGQRGALVRHFLEQGRVAGFAFANSFEAATCGLEEHFTPRAAATHTAAQPGSAAKVAVLAARLAAGEELYHPLDESRPIWTNPL